MPTIQAVIDDILTTIPGAPFAETVDVIKAGDPAQEVTGVVTTFLATCAVLQKAADLGANFVIAHEPTFYTHLDHNDWLKDDPVYRAKLKLIEDNHLVVWRFHDYWHSHRPDGIMTGMLQALDWTQYTDSTQMQLRIPTTTLGDLMTYLKEKIGCHRAFMIGNPAMPCSKIALVPGSPGGEFQIKILSGDIDVMIVGETNEWQTPEYVRDAQFQGQSKAMIVLGHEVSEEAGMAYLVEWLRPRFPDVKATHVPSGDPF